MEIPEKFKKIVDFVSSLTPDEAHELGEVIRKRFKGL